MKIRKITSLTASVSFLLLILNSVVLYIVPQGRVAYWSDWRLWGLTKTEWGNQHIIIGILFLLALFLHIYYNWVLDFSESIKTSAANKYGEPPYGHAELSSLKSFASKTGLDLAGSMARLKSAGVRFENERQTLLNIAKLNKMTPQQVYLAMIPEEKPAAEKSLLDSPPQGIGKRSLADICREYSLEISIILKGFADNDIQVAADMTVKQIAVQHEIGTAEIYEILRNAAKKST
jgi:hypothetical protein